MCDRDDEEAGSNVRIDSAVLRNGRGGSPVRIIGNTSESVIPSQERREQREEAAGLDDGEVRRTHGVTM